VLPLFGSIAGAESILLALDDRLRTTVAMAEAPHGTAPSLQGKDIANPMAMLLAAATVLAYAAARGDDGARGAAQAIREAVLETSAEGIKTIDIGGDATTSGFTSAVVDKVRVKVAAASRVPSGEAAGR
jgi:isocitrate dehydrogenase (NAD+)